MHVWACVCEVCLVFLLRVVLNCPGLIVGVVLSVLFMVSLGMLDAGIGETHVNSFLTALDIPPIPHKTLKKSLRDLLEVLVACKDHSSL